MSHTRERPTWAIGDEAGEGIAARTAMNGKLAHLGIVLVILGAALLLTPSFGFETIAADRPADVDTAEDEHATIGFEATNDGIDSRTDAARLFWLRNNAGQELTLATLHRLSIAGLLVTEDGQLTLQPGGAAPVSVECGDFGGSDTATLTTIVDSASGETLTISGAASTVSFLADCAIPSVVWNTTADWDAGTDDRTVSDDVGDRQSDTVRLGYSADESGLVGYWPLDEDGGSTAIDASPYGNDGEHVNGPSVGRPGVLNSTTYEFEPANDQYVQVPNSNTLQTGDSVSVAAWVRMDGNQDGAWTAVVQKSNEGYNLQIENGNQPVFTVFDGNYQNVRSNEYLDAGEWHHLVGTYDGDTARIYVDGELANGQSGIGQMDTGTVGVGIGENLVQSGRQFDGRIEEVRIYDHGLSADEVANLYYTADNGTHTTDWRSTDGALMVDDLFLQNVSTSLGGTDATVHVESDADGDGTVDETSDPIALSDDATEYQVTGLANDTDRVRLRAEFATETVSRTPILSRAELSEKHPYFDVAVDGTDEQVVEGEDLAVDVTVTNTGYDPDTQTVELRDLDGTVVDSAEMSLDVGETQSATLTWATAAGDAGSGDVTVTSEDDSDAASVTVQRPANLTVAIDGTNSYVTAGEVLRVDATIANEGGAAATQNVTLSTEGIERDDRAVTLAGGERTSITLDWATTADDVGIYDATVASEDDGAVAEVSVVHPDGPTWETDADWSDGAVRNRTVSDDVGDRESDTVRLGYDADDSDLVGYWPLDEDSGSTATDVVGGNHGDHVGSGIGLGERGLLNASRYQFDGTSRVDVADDPAVQLDGDFAISFWIRADGTLGSSDNENLQTFFVEKSNYETDGYQILDNGDYSDEIVFRVNEANTAYDVRFARSKINDGSWHQITAVREGDEIRLYRNGTLESSLAGTGYDTNTELFSLGASPDVDGHLEGDMDEVRIYDGSLSDADVQALYDTTASGSHTTDWRPTGGPLNASELQLENVSIATGGERATAYVESDTDHDGAVDETSDAIALSGDARQYDVGGLTTHPDRVRLRVEFETGDLYRTPIVSRIELSEKRPTFDVAIDATNSPVTEGEALTVDVTVTNLDDRSDTQTIELRDVDGTVVDAVDVSLGAGETNGSVTLTWATEGGDEGTGDVTVASPDRSAAQEVTVEDGSQFDVTIDGANDPVVEGEPLTVNATVTNSGTVTDTETVALAAFDGTVVDAVDVTLAPDESDGSIALTWQTQKGDSGTGDVSVDSGDDVATREVTVEQAATFDVAIAGTNDPVMEGEDLEVDLIVTNVGDREGTQTVALDDFGGQQVDATEVSLGAGETDGSTTLVWSTGDGDGGTDDVTVRSDDTTATQTVTVEQPASFEVAIDGTNSPVVEGETLTVDVNVTNPGDYADEQTVTLANLAGGVVDETTVALGPGESDDTITLAWTTAEGDAGSGDVTVASENDTATAAVTVEQLLGPGDLHAENVSANVQPGEESQTFTYVIDGGESTENDNFDFKLDLDGAQSNGIDYVSEGDPTWSVEPEKTWGDWIAEDKGDTTGPHFQMEILAPDDEIRITITGYQTEGSAGPFTVQLKDNYDGGTVLAEDEFWID